MQKLEKLFSDTNKVVAAANKAMGRRGKINHRQIETLLVLHLKNGRGPTAVAKSLGISGAAMTGYLDRLQEKALVVREQDRDRRRRPLKLTPLAIAVLEAADGALLDTPENAL